MSPLGRIKVLMFHGSSGTPCGPYRAHSCIGLIVAGSAEAGLGNYERALEYLQRCGNEMSQYPMMSDWHHRMPLQRALIEAWLTKGDLLQARVEAEEFLKVALITEERMFRAQAYEVNARLAIAEHDLDCARDFIAKAVQKMVGYEVPLAHRRVQGTAAEFYRRLGNRDLAEHNPELSRATIMKLADSVPPDEPLRNKFLSAPAIPKILGEEGLRSNTSLK